MNDPYKQQRLDLCKKQTMIHNANCVGCSKLTGLTSFTVRNEICSRCDISSKLQHLGKEILQCTRPRKKMPIQIKILKETVADTRIEEYLKMRSDGLSHGLIAAKWKVCVDTVRRFVKVNNLVTKTAKSGPKNEILDNLTIEKYFELKKKWGRDTRIAIALNCPKSTIMYFKRKNGLMKKIKTKGAM